MRLTLKEYQPLTQRTCPDLGSIQLNLSHMTLGMCSELSELTDAYDKEDNINVAEEIADIMWYLGGYANFRKLDLSDIIENTDKSILGEEDNKGLEWYICELADLVKKFIAYGKPIDENKEKLYLIAIILNAGLHFEHNEGFQKALFNNIEKLRVRYPDKFTNENALNRNLEEERKKLEQ